MATALFDCQLPDVKDLPLDEVCTVRDDIAQPIKGLSPSSTR